ncbi:MAG: sulfatase-like hydrolase/transferase [Planctomycetota bacterium]
MSKFLRMMTYVVLGFVVFAQQCAASRPNFLVIVADDLTWSDLGYEGNTQVQTQNVDSLRSESLHLTRMFTAASMCSPFRQALYTGLFPVRSGAYPNDIRAYKGTKSLFTHLNAAGYRTALQEKRHVGPAESFPYEYIEDSFDFDATKSFMVRGGDQPWLLVYGSNHPHSSWQSGPVELYDPDAIRIPHYLHDNTVTRELLAAYYVEITELDNQVGRLLGLLEESGNARDTVVMFFSEQGSSLPYVGKWSLYDTGIRASTLVRWPGVVAPGTSSDALMQYVDVAPTVLEAASIDPDAVDVGCPSADGRTGFDGLSFADVLTGKASALREYVFAEHTTVGVHGCLAPYRMRAVKGHRLEYIRNVTPENTYSVAGLHRRRPIASWQRDAESDPEPRKRVRWLFERPEFELYDLTAHPFAANNRVSDPSFST